MGKRLRVALATACASALTGGLFIAGTTSASAATGLQGDFNGDGYRDVAVSAPYAAVNGHTGAGSVSVLYGSPDGAGAGRIQTVSQDSAGVPGAAETDDYFGGFSTAGDFNGDGYADLAVAVTGEDVGSDTDGGTAVILWGGQSGLNGGTTVSDPAPTSHDHFGNLLVAGDYDGDGRADLAVSADNNKLDIYRGGFTADGTTGGHYTVTTPVLPVKGLDIFNLTPGDVNGDGRTDLLVDGFDGDAVDTDAYNENYYLAGATGGLTAAGAVHLPAGVISDIGDVDNDGYGDIVIGNDWDAGTDSAGIAKGGAVKVVYGTESGPGGEDTVTQDSTGVPGASESGDGFGYEVSMGDVDGDGYDDLAIGAPGEDLNGIADAGMVTVLHGSSIGFREPRAQALAQDTPGVPGDNEAGDGFGGEVFLSDTTGDGKADLVVGVPWENGGNGQAVAFTSDGTQLDTAARGIGLTAAQVSSVGTPYFGAQLAG
ncbi:FG-GAP-like repeat-containing protein [Streptomyces odontomachi]|uniref:FG-GAP-like repeat-containing protein n=1 Tax=Streptomyces odontomachi TaxID=2944940 RepID=UPI00210A04D9|nr:FG-GAP-like repeat-containing protein [Streptomyces sp. ODS25]